jgi:hypothetical protein
MKTDWSHLDPARKSDGPFGTQPGERQGAFYVQRGRTMFVMIASCGGEGILWEHVSLRALDYKGERCPTWDEMCWAKGLFWGEEECVVQYHPPVRTT